MLNSSSVNFNIRSSLLRSKTESDENVLWGHQLNQLAVYVLIGLGYTGIRCSNRAVHLAWERLGLSSITLCCWCIGAGSKWSIPSFKPHFWLIRWLLVLLLICVLYLGYLVLVRGLNFRGSSGENSNHILFMSMKALSKQLLICCCRRRPLI